MNYFNLFIDPGDKNLAIALLELKEIHYFKNNSLENNFHLIRQHIISKLKRNQIEQIRFNTEKQIYFKNIFIEGLILGFLINEFNDYNFKTRRIGGYKKTEILKKIFNNHYKKFNRKYLKSQSINFREQLNSYKVIKYENNCISEVNILKEKKIDDIIDVFIMSFNK